ncbi:class I SAM-dependent rRNA methyltransferase [Enterococcus columbae]|uniref:SAM-dependent methyltransferase n=1 Tax=Enterococcus columbae DSM 7374 = ATCC 51263 TaxID=1121865 RepID=S0KAP4_9ENTE|nr:class I SAM-dependent rRNA methyltransferase [Enterococcus columbae]EOT41919.1 SAM-dependent methyltransferase [Enterococcus columbae DSM 7374 = ATCC 51263]EOW80476.1 SAM-dependent methyltransferase [Enterococcus columbae DSM 7374 = ATCC 51263]OJG26447.1 SAM-dependent methyltransferase [Enterococcus columbae DSM 7374 = ATCC 51263]
MSKQQVFYRQKLTNQAKKRVLNGVPLIQQEDCLDLQVVNQWVDFVDEKNQWIAQGYLGKQNKGVGWVLSLTKQPFDQAFFTEKLLSAKKVRQYFFNQDLTTAFRLFNGEGDGIGGVTIDYYQGYAVISWYNATIYQFKALILAAFLAVYPDILGIYEKNRFETKLPETQHIYGQTAPEPLIIRENGIQYATYLNEGWMTGIFLDQKDVRGYLSNGFASGKSVLNMFSYTGAFSVAAAMGGASMTTSVDLAKRSLPKTKEQFSINGIDPATQKIHVMDTFDYFHYARKKGLKFDLIILDPPSFARNGKKVFSVAKNYGQLIADSLPILNKQGWIVASTNAANVSSKKFKQMIEQEFKGTVKSYQLLNTFQLPADFAVRPTFAQGNYLKVFIYQIVQ